MEQFFKPSQRNRDIWELDRDDGYGPFEHTEVELAVPVEDFLSYRWDWKDLRAFLTGGDTPKILWITENAFLAVVKENGNFFPFDFDKISDYVHAIFQETSGQEQELALVHLDHEDISTGEASIFWRAITTSNSVKLTIGDDEYILGLPSGPLLSQFLRKSLSLQVLEFNWFHFKEEHCRALATLQRKDLKVKFTCCKLDPQDAEDTFIEWFRHNQVLTELIYCRMENSIFSAFSGNNSVKKITLDAQIFGPSEEKMRSLLLALPGNMGIEHLAFVRLEMSDETWILLFRSLSTHPRINYLSIDNRFAIRLSAESKSTMMNAIIQMLHLNTVVLTIEVPDAFRDEAVYQNVILPRLEMNRTCFEVQRQAVKRADPSIRPQLLGRALHVVRFNPNLLFQFLSENVPAFVRTEDEEEDSVIPLENDSAIVSGQKRKAPS
jgi:hypothetical protein